MRLLDDSSPQQLADVRRMLDAGVPVNTPFDAGGADTPLTHAAGFGHPDVVRLLLERGANPNSRNADGETALWNAANAPLSESGDYTKDGPQPPTPTERRAWTTAYVNIIRSLLARGANPNLSNDNGVTPLGVAAYRGREAQVAALLQGGASPSVRDRFGKTPLEWAAYNQNSAIVRLLRTHGARIGRGRTLPSQGQRTRDKALLQAVAQRDIASAKLWLGRRADPNARTNISKEADHAPMQDFSSPLLSAVDSPRLTRLLLQAGANANGQDDQGHAPLMTASPQVAKLLLAGGARVNIRDNRGETALMSSGDSPAKVRLLLSRGAQVKDRDEEGETALLKCRDVVVLELLLQAGANINEADNSGHTGLMNAAQQNYGEGGVTCDAPWARVLLRHGADPNRRNDKGKTALMILAAPFGHAASDVEYYDNAARISFARMLLSRGARRDLGDSAGKTALDTARQSGAWRLARLLKGRN